MESDGTSRARAPARALVRGVLLVALTAVAFADDLPKPYFAATKPGTWARYESKSPQVAGRTVYTYVRLPDDAGRAVVSLRVDFPEGPYKGQWSKTTYVLRKGFDAERELINFLTVVEASTYEVPGQPPMPEANEATLQAIRQAVSNYDRAFTPKGSATAEGRSCDFFSYRAPSGGPNPTVDTGEIWLDASIPFGIVRQVGTITDKQGAVLSKYDMRLLGQGQGQPPPLGSEPTASTKAPPSPAAAPSEPRKASGKAAIGD